MSTAVNRAENDSPALIEPLPPGAAEAEEAKPAPRARSKPKDDDRQGSLF